MAQGPYSRNSQDAPSDGPSGTSAAPSGSTDRISKPSGVSDASPRVSDGAARETADAFQPVSPMADITCSAGSAERAVPVAATQVPAVLLISPTAPDRRPLTTIRSSFTRISRSHEKGSRGASARIIAPSAVPATSDITSRPGRQSASPARSVSAPRIETSADTASRNSDLSGRTRHDAVAAPSWALPFQTEPVAAIPGARPKARLAGRVAANVSRYAASPNAARIAMRRASKAAGAAPAPAVNCSAACAIPANPKPAPERAHGRFCTTAGPAPPAQSGADAGFTLVEVVIAVGLLGLIALAGFTMLDGEMRVQAGTDGRLDRLASLQRAMIVMTSDLEQLSAGGIEPTDGGFAFRRFSAEAGMGDVDVRYALVGDTFRRSLVGGPQTTRTQNLVTDVASANWSFYSPSRGWRPDWPPEDAHEGERPAAVAIELALKGAGPAGRLRRVVELPAGK